MNSFSHQESKVTKILHWVSLLAVGSTFFGFLIVNTYLALYGFWDFNLLKVQYFSAGGLFLFFVTIPVIFSYVFFKAEDILEKYRVENRTVIRSVSVFTSKILLFILAVSLSFALFIFPLILGKTINPLAFIYFLGVIWVSLIFLGVSIALKSHKEILETRTKRITLRNIIIYFGAHYRLLYFLFVIPILILIFSIFVYSSIPRYLGGGRPVAVMIGLNASLSGQEIGVENPFNAIMVYESENSVLVLIDGGTYLIKQADINYVKYLETVARVHGLQEFGSISTTTLNRTP